MTFKVKTKKPKKKKIIYDDEYYLGKNPRKTKYYKRMIKDKK
jgi:hypothetical protein